MNFTLIFIFLISIIISILIVLYIFTYNKLQSINIKINESEMIIDEQLRNKYDLIEKAKITINKLLKKEINYFKDLEKLKSDNITNFELDRKITEGVNLVNKIKNDYKSLEDNSDYMKIIDDLKDSEEILEASKSFYNKYTTEINMIIKKFPSNLIAKIHKIKIRNYFDGKNMFDDEIKDFKL